jgi:hypothetical protein
MTFQDAYGSLTVSSNLASFGYFSYPSYAEVDFGVTQENFIENFQADYATDAFHCPGYPPGAYTCGGEAFAFPFGPVPTGAIGNIYNTTRSDTISFSIDSGSLTPFSLPDPTPEPMSASLALLGLGLFVPLVIRTRAVTVPRKEAVIVESYIGFFDNGRRTPPANSHLVQEGI